MVELRSTGWPRAAVPMAADSPRMARGATGVLARQLRRPPHNRQRHRHMLVNRLTLIIIFRMLLAVWACDRLGRLVCFESEITLLMLLRLLLVSKAAVAKHQVVLRLQVFRIDLKHGIQDVNAIFIFALQKQNSAKVIQRNSVTWILHQQF